MNELTTWERIKARLTEASTVRGIILLIGLLGYKLLPEEIAGYVAVVDAVIYIAYEILRTDSAKKAVVEINESLRSAKVNILPAIIVTVLLSFLLLGPIPPAHADNVSQFQEIKLQWSPNTEPDMLKYRVYISATSGTYDSGTDAKAFQVVMHPTAETSKFMLPVGTHYFVVTAVDTEGFESAYSNEVVAVVSDDAPSAPGGCAIIKF